MKLDVLLEWTELDILAECLKSQKELAQKNIGSSGSNNKNQYNAKIMQYKVCYFYADTAFRPFIPMIFMLYLILGILLKTTAFWFIVLQASHSTFHAEPTIKFNDTIPICNCNCSTKICLRNGDYYAYSSV